MPRPAYAIADRDHSLFSSKEHSAMVYGEKVYLRPFTRAYLPLFEHWANDISHNSEFNTIWSSTADYAVNDSPLAQDTGP